MDFSYKMDCGGKNIGIFFILFMFLKPKNQKNNFCSEICSEMKKKRYVRTIIKRQCRSQQQHPKKNKQKKKNK